MNLNLNVGIPIDFSQQQRQESYIRRRFQDEVDLVVQTSALAYKWFFIYIQLYFIHILSYEKSKNL